jgi:hypothetical protein
MSDDRPAPKAEQHLDCLGNLRTFRLGTYAAGTWLEALELRPDDTVGLRFVLPVPFDGVPPYDELRKMIQTRLAQRSIARHPTDGWQVLDQVIRGQLREGDDEAIGPNVLVDDVELTWAELGQVLMGHVGFGVRVVITDEGQE